MPTRRLSELLVLLLAVGTCPLVHALGTSFAAPAVLPGREASSDEEYDSENKASSVRPSPRNRVLEASDVRGIATAEGKKVTVKGKVHSVYLSRTKKVLKLNLGPNYRTCFTVAIFSESFIRWNGGTDGIRRSYDGRTIAVTGEVKLYQGQPEIIVRGPADIKAAD
jgi:hypothetical protein